jgi:hypothetical protein
MSGYVVLRIADTWAWRERNATASPEEIEQMLLAPDHVLWSSHPLDDPETDFLLDLGGYPDDPEICVVELEERER